MDFAKERMKKQSRLESQDGYNNTSGWSFGICRPITGFDPIPFQAKHGIWHHTFPDKKALEDFIDDFTFFRYGGRCPSWYTVLWESDLLSQEEKNTHTLNGKSYTPEAGKARVVELLHSGELALYGTDNWIPAKDRNHHLVPKARRKVEYLPVTPQPYSLGPHDMPGVEPPARVSKSATERRKENHQEQKRDEKIDLSTFDEIYAKTPAAKSEIDSMADEISEMSGGQVAKAPIKSRERAIQKIMDDYGGDTKRIKDLARNTIIVSPDKINPVVTELAKHGASVKVINGATDPLGYSGVNSTIKTQAGIFGEVQVNTPAMIYAKEPESIAKALPGNDLYNSIAVKAKIPGGQGHKLYEQWRILPASDPGRSVIETKSKAYYDVVRSSIYGN